LGYLLRQFLLPVKRTSFDGSYQENKWLATARLLAQTLVSIMREKEAEIFCHYQREAIRQPPFCPKRGRLLLQRLPARPTDE
jgi:hypothetical protein